MAELFELMDEVLGAVLGGAAPLCPVRAELGVVNIVVDDVPVGDEQVVAGSADGCGRPRRPRVWAWWATMVADWISWVRRVLLPASVIGRLV